MKKYFLTSVIVVITLCFYQCKKEDLKGPNIALVKPVDNTSKIVVPAFTKVTIEAVIKDNDGLKSIETYYGSSLLWQSQVSKLENNTEYDYKSPEITVNKETQITIVATDVSNNSNSVDIVYTPKITETINYTSLILYGADTARTQYIDLDAPKVYRMSDLNDSNIRNSIDLYFSNYVLSSTFEYNGKEYNSGTLLTYTYFKDEDFASIYYDYNYLEYKGQLKKVSLYDENFKHIIFFETKKKGIGLMYVSIYPERSVIDLTVKKSPEIKESSNFTLLN
jgi:hypothetical protein